MDECLFGIDTNDIFRLKKILDDAEQTDLDFFNEPGIFWLSNANDENREVHVELRVVYSGHKVLYVTSLRLYHEGFGTFVKLIKELGTLCEKYGFESLNLAAPCNLRMP